MYLLIYQWQIKEQFRSYTAVFQEYNCAVQFGELLWDDDRCKSVQIVSLQTGTERIHWGKGIPRKNRASRHPIKRPPKLDWNHNER